MAEATEIASVARSAALEAVRDTEEDTDVTLKQVILLARTLTTMVATNHDGLTSVLAVGLVS